MRFRQLPALLLTVCAAATYDVKIENNVDVKMRDGVVLRADIYRPRTPGKYPVILERTPYDKRGGVGFGLKVAGLGYVYIIQDVRGRNASEGDWYAFKFEPNDGYDTVEWAAALPYANGKVGMFGGSYVGATQMLAAIAAPPHLSAIMPVVTASNYHSHWAYQGGAFEQLVAQAWSSALAIDGVQRRAASSSAPAHWDFMKSPAAYPVIDPGSTAGLAQYYFDWIRHPAYDDYWKQWSIEDQFAKITVPAFHIAAWYDLFQDGSLRNYIGLKKLGRAEQRLLIAVGGHAGATPKIGDVDFGPANTLDTWALGIRWYDWILKGIDNGMAKEKPVRVFVMGANAWRDEDSWPPARAVETRYYLHPGGRLAKQPPAPADPGTSTGYIYDPADPTPTNGGGTLGDVGRYPPGPLFQARTEARKDVVVFTTAPFDRDTEITGPVRLELYASSSAVDTDFTGKLTDVSPDGASLNLTDGILRARYRNSMERPELLEPGKVYRLVVELWSTSNVFKKGHRLRVQVASANFPRFDRNHNVAELPATAQDSVKATNTIYHSSKYPSALVVPVIPE